MIIKLAEAPLETQYGMFVETLLRSADREAICLHRGTLAGQSAVPLRVHSQCLTGHVFNGVECDCAVQMAYAQALIAAQRCGLIIWLDHEGKGNGHLAKMLSVPYKLQGLSQELAYEKVGYPRDNREYSLVAQVLEHFAVASITLITNNPRKEQALLQLGVSIEGVVHTPAIRDPSWSQRVTAEGERSRPRNA